MTGLEAYDALKMAVANLGHGSEFRVHGVDALDLMKLNGTDLENRGYEKKIAKDVSDDLLAGKLVELGRSIGLKLIEDRKAPRLIPRA